MSYLLAFLGFAALIMLHEFGHFAAAKAVGMRVEKFCLFFGPMLVKKRWGETVYGIAPIPLGGYVKISGMNPEEPLDPAIAPRAYCNQPVWKRVVVIAAGPFVNIVLAFAIFWVLIMSVGHQVPSTTVTAVVHPSAAAGVLRPGDRIVSVDGVRGDETVLRNEIATHRCAGVQVNGCKAQTPVRLVVVREGHLQRFDVTPRYSSQYHRALVGFEFGSKSVPTSVGAAASLTTTDLWKVSTQTVSAVARLFQPQDRSQVHGIVGAYTVEQQSVNAGATQAFEVLALISLSLGIINLFPFLPLDGGHIFWAVAEKVRGRRIPLAVMERAGFVGVALILTLFVIGLSNDIHALNTNQFHP